MMRARAENLNLGLINENEQRDTCGYSLVWFRTSACHADDPGSNPGGRITLEANTHDFGAYSSYFVMLPMHNSILV